MRLGFFVLAGIVDCRGLGLFIWLGFCFIWVENLDDSPDCLFLTAFVGDTRLLIDFGELIDITDR